MVKFIAQFFILFVTLTVSARGTDHFKGEFYHKNSKPQVSWAMDMIKKITSPQVESFELLDVGCGDGKITGSLQEMFPNAKVTGLDPNDSMIQEAASFLSPIQWLKLPIEDIEYMNKFDVVTSFSVLHWIKNLDYALAKIHTAMRPNSTAYFVSCAKKDLDDRLGYSIELQRESEKWKDSFSNQPPTNDIIKLYTVEDMKMMLQKASFYVSECQMVETVHTFSSKEEFNKWTCGWSPYGAFLKDRHKEFWDDVIDKYCTFYASYDDGKIDYVDYMLHIIVKKSAA